jgi:hypothetical protein
LNDEIDEHFHDNLLSLADRCSCGRVLVSSCVRMPAFGPHGRLPGTHLRFVGSIDGARY